MLYFKSLTEAEEVLRALSAPMRLQIMELLYQNESMSMNDLAQKLQITNGAISMHVSKLEEAGLVRIRSTSGKRGTMKLVSARYDRLMIDMAKEHENSKCYVDDIRIGYYTAFSCTPTCGLATAKSIVGSLDDIRAFTFPERFQAGILWFSTGYVEYSLPNHLQKRQRLKELQISFEISSECPGTNDEYPSDIEFSINQTLLGCWTSPGDYGKRKGFVSPGWWSDTLNQYGLLKTLIINSEGTFMDGSQKLSDVTIEDLQIDSNAQIILRFEVSKKMQHCGGCTLFGEEFGDYAQGIRIKAYYDTIQ